MLPSTVPIDHRLVVQQEQMNVQVSHRSPLTVPAHDHGLTVSQSTVSQLTVSRDMGSTVSRNHGLVVQQEQTNAQALHGLPVTIPRDKDSDNDESVGSSALESTKFMFNTVPQLGYRMPTNFTKQIWSNIISLCLGFELYRILFLSAITKEVCVF